MMYRIIDKSRENSTPIEYYASLPDFLNPSIGSLYIYFLFLKEVSVFE